MTTVRKEAPNTIAAKRPPVRGGSTAAMMVSLSACAPVSVAKKLPIIAAVPPLNAKAVLLETSFASLRYNANHAELHSNTLAQKIDDEKNMLPKNKETTRLESVFSPFRSESTSLASAHKILKDDLNTLHPQFIKSLIDMQQDILAGNTKPSHIEPKFSGLARAVSEKQRDLDKLKMNDSHLTGRMQSIDKQVTFQVVAVKSGITPLGAAPSFE